MTKRICILFLTAFGAAVSVCASFGPLSPSATPYEREYIWPEGKMPDVQPHQIAAKTEETKAPGFKADDFRRPYIEWFAPNPACKTDLCVLIISGGGFNCCCDAARLQPAIDRFVRAGFTVANLTYRTPRPKGLPIYQSAWEDAQRAVRVIRSQAAKRPMQGVAMRTRRGSCRSSRLTSTRVRRSSSTATRTAGPR